MNIYNIKVRAVPRVLWLPVMAIAALAMFAAGIVWSANQLAPSLRSRADALVFKKTNVEGRVHDATADVEDFLIRAYPAGDIPVEASLAARSGWAALNAASHSDGTWRLIGPSQATVPAVLNALGDGAVNVTAGRITALAIGPSCFEDNCLIYVAAAGGGVWRTTDGLGEEPQWQFVTTSFGTNAIGSLLLDPKDSSGNTVYAATGEGNAAVDSEAGVGIYKSTDGGDTWSLVAGSDIFSQRSIDQMALDNAGNLLVALTRGVRGVNSTDGGPLSSGSQPLAAVGLYRQRGSTFDLIFTPPNPTRGPSNVKVDPAHPGIIYVNAYQQGIWRSTDNGGTFTQIFAAQDPTPANIPFERTEFDVTTLPSGATRMYVGEGQGGETGHHSNFFRSDDADTAATFVSMGGAQVDDYCDGQCWYDNVVFTPAGHPDIVYLLGSFNYPLFFQGLNNGRAVLLSTDGGATWSDLTQDGKATHANATHPDQHAIVVNPNNPFQYWEGSDGGVVRSDGEFEDVSYKCDTRGLNPADTATCRGLLWRVPRNLDSLNTGFSTLQFQSLSVSRQHPFNNIQGGTQDNGTFQYTGNSVVWRQEIYGDGGQSGFNAANEHLRFNSFATQAHDANFHNGDPTQWVIISGPIFNSPEGSYFYPPLIADPNPTRAGSIFEGSFSVWRTQDWGGSQAYLEANCPEFTSNITPNCGDFLPIGPAGQTDLTDSGTYGPPVYGTDRTGGSVSYLSRSTNPRDTGTLWASTGPGRVFISTNANDDAASVVWTRIDDASGGTSIGRHPTSIYVDPTSHNHAWISYSGYNRNTPSLPGHVFDVTWNGESSTWTDLSYDLPDLPITSVVLDSVTGDLYASSDFGVMRLAHGSTSWTVAGSGLPMVEVPGLTIVPSARLLYAATHGRSAWRLRLPGGDE
jgi:hypothetical protein